MRFISVSSLLSFGLKCFVISETPKLENCLESVLVIVDLDRPVFLDFSFIITTSEKYFNPFSSIIFVLANSEDEIKTSSKYFNLFIINPIK
jgi:hypothetical protein